jgi:hypothetical protein
MFYAMILKNNVKWKDATSIGTRLAHPLPVSYMVLTFFPSIQQTCTKMDSGKITINGKNLKYNL